VKTVFDPFIAPINGEMLVSSIMMTSDCVTVVAPGPEMMRSYLPFAT